MANGLQKYVDDQSAVERSFIDYGLLQAYNKGVARRLAEDQLRASFTFPDPQQFPTGMRLRGGGSDGVSVGYGSVDNSDYESLATGGKVNRVKKANKWLDFVDKALGTGEKHATAVKSIAGAGVSGGKKKINRVKKANKWLDFTDKALTAAEKHALAIKSIAGAGDPQLQRPRRRKVKEIVGAGEPVAPKKRAPSAWLQHVKQYAAEHNMPYRQAMSEAKATYKK